MSYGSLYKTSYYDWFGDLTEIYIKKKSYAGAMTEINCGMAPLKLSIDSPTNDKFQNVRGTHCEIQLFAETDFQFLDLYTSDSREYLIQIDKDSTLYWKGWILPDEYQEPYVNTPYPVTLRASDGLGMLKGFDFDWPYQDWAWWNSLQDFIDFILGKINSNIDGTGLVLDLYENLDIYEDNQSSTAADSPLNQTYMTSVPFYDKDQNPMSCYDALVSILKPFNAYITQNRGAWHIVRVPTNQSAYTRRLLSWSDKGASYGFNYTSNAAYNPVVATTSASVAKASLVRLMGNTLNISPGWKEFTIIQDYGLGENLIHGDFQLSWFPPAGGITHWSLVDSPTISSYPWSGGYLPIQVNNRTAWLPKDMDIKNAPNDWGVKLTGDNVGTGGAGYIEEQGVSVVTDAASELIITFDFKAINPDTEIHIMAWVDTGTPQYLSADGTWDTTPVTMSWDLNGDTSQLYQTKTVQIVTTAGAIPANGTFKVRLYESINAGSSTDVMYHNVRVGYLPAGESPKSELISHVSVNSNNNHIPATFDLPMGDAPAHNNNNLYRLYNNKLHWNNGGAGTPTSSWTDAQTTSDTLVNCMATNMALQNNQSYERISGTITSKLIDFLTIIDETNHSNYYYFFNRATLNDKEGTWDVDMIQLANEFNIAAEDASTLITEASDNLITE